MPPFFHGSLEYLALEKFSRMQWSVCIAVGWVVANFVLVVCQIIAISVTLSRIFFLTGELPPKKNECLKCSVGCQFFQHLGGSGSLKITQQTSNCHQTSSRRVFCCWKNSRKIWESYFFVSKFLGLFGCKFASESYICWLHFRHFIG